MEEGESDGDGDGYEVGKRRWVDTSQMSQYHATRGSVTTAFCHSSMTPSSRP